MKRKLKWRRIGLVLLAGMPLGCGSAAVTEKNASVPAPSEPTTASSWAAFREMYVSEPIVINDSAPPSAGTVTITKPSGSQITFGQLTVRETPSFTAPDDSEVTVINHFTSSLSGTASEPTTAPVIIGSDTSSGTYYSTTICDGGRITRYTPTTRPTELSPGVYSTAPYSMLVLVPPDIDPYMAFDPGGQSNMPITDPGLRFEKLPRDIPRTKEPRTK